jgi:protein-S-isoprenylcysteine O-methyltransferase Ste14
MGITRLIDFLCRSSTAQRAQPGTPLPSPDTAAALRTIANFVLIVLFVQLAFDSVQHFMDAATLSSSGMLVVNGLILGLFLSRREAKTETTSAALWLLGYAGTMLPLLMRPSEPPGRGLAGAIVELAGLAMLTAALLSLRRSFAIVPANHGVREGGLYRLVRHPVYISELTLLLGVLIANPTRRNALLWLIECGLQFARALAEERHLAADPRYLAYCGRVRYRFIPAIL